MTSAAATDKLAALPGDLIVASREVLDRHGQHVACHPAIPTDAVAFQETIGEVSAILKLRSVEQCPDVPSGAASSQEDRRFSGVGSKSRDLVPMNMVIQVNAADLIEFSELPQRNLKDAVRLSSDCPAWPFGTDALMRNPTARGRA